MRNRYYQGPVSDHFDGVRFFHPGLPSSDKSLIDVIRWKLQGTASRWPIEVPATENVHPPASVDGLEITLVGHSSYLIQVNNVNILVDPVWSKRVSPFKRIGPKRHNPPAIAFDDLPCIDVVLITHNHYDHLDTPTIQKLWNVHRPRILAPLGNDVIMRDAVPDIAVETGDWWDAFALTGSIRVTIVPAYHWSSRGLRDRRMALWGGFVIETPRGVIYCAGDTAYRDGEIFREVGHRFGPCRVAVLPIGAYEPRWFMEMQHANPEDAMRIANDCRAEYVLGVHWGTFALTDEPFDQPAERLAPAVEAGRKGGIRYRAMRPGDLWPSYAFDAGYES